MARSGEITLTVQAGADAFAHIAAEPASRAAERYDWSGEWIGARASRRDRAYDLLRAAGDEGVSILDFHLADVPCPAVHCESLMFEGHAITSQTVPTESGARQRRWYLVKDAWA